MSRHPVRSRSTRNFSNATARDVSAGKPAESRFAGNAALPYKKAKSVKAFCDAYGISVASFYRNIDEMPRSILVGKQRRILWEDEYQWLASQRYP
jgi:hypothetical protein